jgi:nucleoid-associated protein YgaU
LVVSAIVVVALILFGIYRFRESAPPTEPKPQAEQSETAPEAPEAATAPAGAPAAQVPSFDVVRVEGTGEGVIAGRATPGWTVQVASGENVLAETKADAEGAWTIVLDKPLAAGDHSLSLKAISPDGTSSITSQQPVNVAVGEKPAEPEKETAAAEPAAQPGEPAGAAEQPASAKPRPVIFTGVQYDDTGPETGKLSIAGEGDPGASVLLYFDEQSLGQVTIGPDGTWTFEADTKPSIGDHRLRADRIEAGTGAVIGGAAIGMRRTEEGASVSSQPQTVYPEGPPLEATPPPPSTEVVAVEPPSEASQPQPVYPEGSPETGGAPSVEAETPSEPAASVALGEAPDPGQPRPVYSGGAPEPSTSQEPEYPTVAIEAPSEASQPKPAYPAETAEAPAPAPSTPAIVAERPGEGTRAPAAPMVLFRSVDYQDTGAGSGRVALSGSSDPGARILLFLDDAPLGEATAGSDGNWSFEADRSLEIGEHVLRADRVEEGTGIVVGRASIRMARMEPPPQVAAQEPAPSAPPAAEPEAPPGEQAAATEETRPAPVAKKKAERPRRPRVYTVRRGDTLWEIAEYYYGGGWRYRAIVRDNRRKIKDPHWIYPKQKFKMPRRG